MDSAASPNASQTALNQTRKRDPSTLNSRLRCSRAPDDPLFLQTLQDPLKPLESPCLLSLRSYKKPQRKRSLRARSGPAAGRAAALPSGAGSSPCMTCSGEMVFFSDLLQISLASEEMRWMNSVQQFTTSSRASLATRTLGSVSLIILLIAARGMVRSSSLPDDEAILAAARSPRGARLPRSRAPARGEPLRGGRCRGRRRCGGAAAPPLLLLLLVKRAGLGAAAAPPVRGAGKRRLRSRLPRPRRLPLPPPPHPRGAGAAAL